MSPPQKHFSIPQTASTYLIIFIISNASHQICQIFIKHSFEVAFNFFQCHGSRSVLLSTASNLCGNVLRVLDAHEFCEFGAMRWINSKTICQKNSSGLKNEMNGKINRLQSGELSSCQQSKCLRSHHFCCFRSRPRQISVLLPDERFTFWDRWDALWELWISFLFEEWGEWVGILLNILRQQNFCFSTSSPYGPYSCLAQYPLTWDILICSVKFKDY